MEAGVTTTEAPEPIGAPPQEPEYHCHVAPEPSDPPVTFSVVEFPWQIGFTLAVAPVGAAESELTVTIKLTQAVVLQVPSART